MTKPLDLSGMPSRRELLAEAARQGLRVEPVPATGEVRVWVPGRPGPITMNNRRKEGTKILRDELRKGQKGENA